MQADRTEELRDLLESRILLLDDHAVVRAGYRQLIDAEPDMQEIGRAHV